MRFYIYYIKLAERSAASKRLRGNRSRFKRSLAGSDTALTQN